MPGGDPGSYEKAAGEGRAGGKLFPRLELVSITFRRPVTNLPEKTTSEAHLDKPMICSHIKAKCCAVQVSNRYQMNALFDPLQVRRVKY